MKQELDRIKGDVETMQRAMGLFPSMAQDWIQWMKRDRWFSLWWCVPGLICIAAAVLPFDHAQRYWGLVTDQWAGILVAATLLVLAIGHGWHVNRKDNRSAAVVRESRKLYGFTTEGAWFGVALLVQIMFYFIWGRHYHIAFEPFMAGLYGLMGSTCLVAALSSRTWILLGFAAPFIAYSLSIPLVGIHSRAGEIMLGAMFVAIALSFSFIQAVQIRQIERQHESH